MHKIEFNNITREFPESIEEMTPAQYRYFAFLELNRQMGKISMKQLEVQFVYFALNMVRTSDAPKVIENVTLLRELVKPYFTTQKAKGKTNTIVDLNFLGNPLPEIVPKKGHRFLGPSAALQNCTYEEVFVQAHAALLEFSNTMEEESLDRLVAILYRPANEKGKRPKFDPETFEDNIPLVQHLHPEVKFGVYLFFASCVKFITTAEALDIGGGNTVNIAQLFKPDPGQSSSKGIGPVGLIYSIAESGVFGNARETASQGVYDVLIRMVQLHEQAKEMKKNAKRNQTPRVSRRR